LDGAGELNEKGAKEGALLTQGVVPPELEEVKIPVFPTSQKAAV